MKLIVLEWKPIPVDSWRNVNCLGWDLQETLHERELAHAGRKTRTERRRPIVSKVKIGEVFSINWATHCFQFQISLKRFFLYKYDEGLGVHKLWLRKIWKSEAYECIYPLETYDTVLIHALTHRTCPFHQLNQQPRSQPHFFSSLGL